MRILNLIRLYGVAESLTEPVYLLLLEDVAITDGRVVQTGQVSGRGRKEIDATGLVVAPGVIDVHTHYDAQLNWDPYASQSCWHGVTSVVN